MVGFPPEVVINELSLLLEYIYFDMSTLVLFEPGRCAQARRGCPAARAHHAQNTIAGRIIPFLVLGFWDKNAVICAGAMPHRRGFPATTGI